MAAVLAAAAVADVAVAEGTVPVQGGSVAVSSAGASSAETKILTLSDALGAALSNDDVKILQRSLDAARATHALNVSRNMPNLSGSAAVLPTYGLNDTTLAKTSGASGVGLGQGFQGGLSFVQGQATSATSGTRLGLSLTQNIPPSPQPPTVAPATTSVAFSLSQAVWDGYPGGQAKAVVDKSLLTLQGRELTARQARSAALAKVKQAYITALTAQRTLALRLEILGKQNSLLKQIEATFALRQASAIDLETARINAVSAELDVETSRHDWALGSQRLANLIGLPPDSAFSVAEIDYPNLPAADLDGAIAMGLATRVDVAQLDVSANSSVVDTLLAKGAGQPVLTATGGLNAVLSWAATPTNGESASLGLRVAMPILDAGAAKAQSDAAIDTVDTFHTQAAQLRKNISADIRDAWWSATIQLKRVDLAKRSADLADAQLNLFKVQNQYGTATNQDLLTAAVNSANAEAAWLTARSGYLLAVLALETAMGL